MATRAKRRRAPKRRTARARTVSLKNFTGKVRVNPNKTVDIAGINHPKRKNPAHPKRKNPARKRRATTARRRTTRRRR